MAYEQRDNSGTLGKNKRKEKDSHPDHRGSCIIGGVEYWISAWIKENNSTHEKFFSLAFQEKDEQRTPVKGPAPASRPHDNRAPDIEIDDDIPF